MYLYVAIAEMAKLSQIRLSMELPETKYYEELQGTITRKPSQFSCS